MKALDLFEYTRANRIKGVYIVDAWVRLNTSYRDQLTFMFKRID